MGFKFPDECDETRKEMLAEVDFDVAAGTIFISDRLTVSGRSSWLMLLRAAIQRGNEQTLSHSLFGRMNPTYFRRKPRSEDLTEVTMPHNAHEVLGEGEFNRYMIRAVCRRAIAAGKQVVIYRAKDVEYPRPESQRRIGCIVDPAALLEDLRANPGGDAVLGVPGGPSSGISVQLVVAQAAS